MERCILEDYQRCSQSHLWKLMMSFYHRKGPESWSQGIVPHFITCNTFIGKSYAQVTFSNINCLRCLIAVGTLLHLILPIFSAGFIGFYTRLQSSFIRYSTRSQRTTVHRRIGSWIWQVQLFYDQSPRGDDSSLRLPYA